MVAETVEQDRSGAYLMKDIIENGGKVWRTVAETLIGILLGSVLSIAWAVWSRMDRLQDRVERLDQENIKGVAADASGQKEREEMYRRLNKLEGKCR